MSKCVISRQKGRRRVPDRTVMCKSNSTQTDAGQKNTYRDGFTERIPDRLLIQEITQLADSLGRTPTAGDMRAKGEYSTDTYSSHFGSWADALRHAGFEPTKQDSVSSEQIISEIERLATELGEPSTSADMRDSGKHSVTVAQTHFGGWNDALRAAGLTPHSRMDIPTGDLLDELHRLTDELGKVPTADEMRAHGRFSHRPYFRQWNGWQTAVRAAGYEPVGYPSGPDNHLWKEEPVCGWREYGDNLPRFAAG